MIADWILSALVVAGALVFMRAAMSLERLQVGDALGPQAFPVIVAICMLCSSLLLAWESWQKQKIGRQPDGPDASAPLPGIAAASRDRARRPTIVLIAMTAWTALYYVAFEPVGYVLSTLIYMSALLFYFHRVNPLINLGYAAAFTTVAYILFTKFLEVVLPSGILQF